MTLEQTLKYDRLVAEYGDGNVKTSYPGPVSVDAVIFSCYAQEKLVWAVRVLPNGGESDPGPWLDLPVASVQDKLRDS